MFFLYNTDNGLKINLIAPIDVKVKDAKLQKNIIGFNDHEVFTYADAKKKSGNAELRKDIDFDDSGADFTVKVSRLLFRLLNVIF